MRNQAVNSQKGRKLEGRWLGPRILVSYTASRLSAYVRKVHGVGKTKRYHLDDILLYNPRSSFRIGNSVIHQGPHGTTPAIIGGHGSGEPGVRAVFLHCGRWGAELGSRSGKVEQALWARLFFNGGDLSGLQMASCTNRCAPS